MEDALRYFREEMRASFETLKELRLEDRALATQRHNENIERFAALNREVKHQNGRVTDSEKQIQSLWHHLYQPKAAPALTHDGQVNFDIVNVDRLKWYGLLVAGTVAATLGFLRLIGKL